jgi:succinate dehydrogenase/fumarate reductase flavoprotein subunit
MSYDVIVIGAGAAGMAAASVAAAEGLRVLLIEKSGKVGGTTAISGGMVWIPANGKMNAAGLADTPELAHAYLTATVGSFDAPVQRAFLARANEAIEYLERRTSVALKPVPNYPDYYPELPGATSGARVLEPVPFDSRELGRSFSLLTEPLPEFTLFGGMMLDRADIPHFRNALRSRRSFQRVLRLLSRYALERAWQPRATSLYLGNALAGRLLNSVLRGNVDLVTNTDVQSLCVEDGRVVGATVLNPEGGCTRVLGRHAVVLATGGFAHDPELRRRLLPSIMAGPYSATAPTSRGDGVRLAMAAGGQIREGSQGNGFWSPVSRFRRRDGTEALFPHTVTDRGKPGVIAVTRAGRRFTNEAVSYHEFVRAMLRTQAITPSAPAYLICDRRFLWRYGLGAIKPFSLRLAHHRGTGYLKQAATLEDLARALEIEPGALTATVAHYNDGARQGVDPEFGRGANVYQRYLGDRDNTPNPCVAPIEGPPFYAIALYPGDLGTAAGLSTDENARVLDEVGGPISGLYACGNDMLSVMDGAYPGPGITLGPALTFGYIAARHIASGA